MMNILDQMKTLPLADATFDLETILRIAVFGTFIGHGWIAAWKLEFSGWVKVRRLMYTQLRLALLRPAPPCFAPASLGLSCSLTLLLPPFPPPSLVLLSQFMRAAGFHDHEAQIIMPLIGWMDVAIAIVTLLRPMELFTAWMVVWAFSTALVRPVSAGLSRALSPMSDNALWGFIERAANWGVPLALLSMQCASGYTAKELYPGVGVQLAPLDRHLNGFKFGFLVQCMVGAFAVLWGLVPVLHLTKGLRCPPKNKVL